MKNRPLNKTVSIFLSLAVVLCTFFSMSVFSSAASYNSIKLDVPRVSQRPGVGDCAIASMASVEAYFHHLPSGDYTSEAYQAVYSANGYSYSAMWSTLGFEPYESFDMQLAYNQLNSGYPVIVHRTSSHYSVVYGYTGNSSKLELSGFLIFDVDDSYSNANANKTLDKWQGSYTLDRMILRRNGLAIQPLDISINGNHPYPYHVKGQTFQVYGMVVSRYSITSVTMKIYDSAGNIAQSSSYAATPNSRSFALSSGDGNMNFSKLAVGNYKYSVWAKDSSGISTSYAYSFSVVAGEGDIPQGGGSGNSGTFTAYKAVATADPYLNIRSGAGTGYSAVGSVPYGATVTITDENSGWGKLTYNGVTGWVYLQYIKPAEINGVYARVTSATSARLTASSVSAAVISVPKNAIVSVAEESSDWVKIKYNGKTGWIMSNLCVSGIGDVDGSGEVNSADALLVLKSSVGQISLSSLGRQIGDMDGNSVVNSADALIILKIAVGQYN